MTHTSINTTQATAQSKRLRLQGEVVSDKMEKTAVVKVLRRQKHPLYHKTVVLAKKYHAHDEKNTYKVGDKVIIEESRPLSRMKRWVVISAQ